MAETKTIEKTDQTDTKRRAMIDLLKRRLVQGAHALYLKPIVRGDKLKIKTTRLNLMAWVPDKLGKWFVLTALQDATGCTMGHVAMALKEIATENLAYVDTSGVGVSDVKGVQDVLEEALVKRGRSLSNVGLDTGAKIAVRDLLQAKTGKAGCVPVIIPAWLLADVEPEPDDAEDDADGDDKGDD